MLRRYECIADDIPVPRIPPRHNGGVYPYRQGSLLVVNPPRLRRHAQDISALAFFQRIAHCFRVCTRSVRHIPRRNDEFDLSAFLTVQQHRPVRFQYGIKPLQIQKEVVGIALRSFMYNDVFLHCIAGQGILQIHVRQYPSIGQPRTVLA